MRKKLRDTFALWLTLMMAVTWLGGTPAIIILGHRGIGADVLTVLVMMWMTGIGFLDIGYWYFRWGQDDRPSS